MLNLLPIRGKEPTKTSNRLHPDEAEALKLIDTHQERANAFRSRHGVGMSIEDELEQNGHRFLGNHWIFASHSKTGSGLYEGYRFFQFGEESSLKGIYHSTLNRTGPAVLSNVAGKTQQPMVVRFDPAEPSGDNRFWLSKDGGEQLRDLIEAAVSEIESERERMVADQPGYAQEINAEADTAREQHLESLGLGDFTPGQMGFAETGEPYPTGPQEPITRQQAGVVRRMIAEGQIEEADLITVNDTLYAKCAQQVWDNRWDLAEGDRYVLMNEFLCEVFGCQPFRMQWNKDLHNFEIENSHLLNVWIDPTHDNLSKSGYLIYDHTVTAEHADSILPDHVSEGDIEAAKGRSLGSTGNIRRARLWQGEHVEDHVVIRTGWFRHQVVPMTEAEAMEAEVVTREPMLDEETGEQAEDEYGKPKWRYFLVETFGEGEDDAEPIGMDEETGEPIFAEPEQTEVFPTNEVNHGTDWPDTRGIRQIKALPGLRRVVEDIRCPFAEIPFAWNVNIPRPDGSPYGIGLPAWVEDISQQINRLLSVVDNYARYYQFPQVWMPQSLFDRLKASGAQMHGRPGAIKPIPDQQWQEVIRAGGFNAMTQDIPTMPAMIMNVFEKLLNEHDKMTGNTEVRQGRAPYSGASGALVNTLAEQSSGVLAFSSKFTEMAVRRLVTLGMDMLVKWLPESEWAKMLNRYELPVIQDIIKGIERTQWNVMVEIASGRGVNRQVDEERALSLFQAGLLSRRTTMERLSVNDPDAEEQRITQDQMNQSQGAAPVQAAAAAAMGDQPQQAQEPVQ